MAYIRDETLDKFTDEQILQMVTECMDELGIPYEEGPGDWSGCLGLDPAADFDVAAGTSGESEDSGESWTYEGQTERYTLWRQPSGWDFYRTRALAGCNMGPMLSVDEALASILGLEANHKPEGRSVLAAA